MDLINRIWVPVALILLLATPTQTQGQQLAFTSDRTGRFQIYKIETDSPGTLEQLTFGGAGNQESRAPDWSGIANRIAYQFGAPGVRGIHLIKPDGSDDVRVTFSPLDPKACTKTEDRRDASWSPDGQFIVFACEVTPGDFDIWIHKVGDPDDPGDDEEYSLLSLSGSLELRPAWSPDGTRIAFITNAFPGPDTEIVVMEVELNTISGRIEIAKDAIGNPIPLNPLTDNNFIDFDPTWSHDSEQIAFSTTRSGGRDIYRMSAESGEFDPTSFVQLTTSSAADRNPAWSPDGTTIAFVSERDGNRNIYLMSAVDGEAGTDNFMQVTDNTASDEDPTWKPLGCGQPAFSPIPSTSIPVAGHNWSMVAEITADDGLELRDVRLGSRYMAVKMNLPYFRLETTNGGSVGIPLSTRCELTPNNNSPSSPCASRLVDFEISTPASPTDVDPVAVVATYEVDNIPSGSNSCVLVTQRYEFDKNVDPQSEPDLACEPGEDLPCDRFRPIVDYQFIPGDLGEKIERIQLPQRLHFSVEHSNPNAFNASLIARDCDPLLPLEPLSILIALQCGFRNVPPFAPNMLQDLGGNPLPSELLISPIVNGQASSPSPGDNYHQTNQGHVVEPGLDIKFNPFSFEFVAPGCEECVHIHWRWSSFFRPFWGFGSQFLAGEPLIPPGSNQSVDIAVVQYKPGQQEEDPQDFRSLANNESLIGLPRVFWYGGEGFLPRDQLFVHGGFFKPNSVVPSAHLSVTMEDSPDPIKADNNLTYTMTVTNSGPSEVTGIILTDTLPSGVTLVSITTSQGMCSGTGVVTCDLGTLDVFANATVTIVVKPTLAAGGLTNTAQVNGALSDPFADDDSASETTTVLTTVPVVVGQPQADAEAAIITAGLVVGNISTASSDTAPASSVVSQNPLGGTDVTLGTAVDLVIAAFAPNDLDGDGIANSVDGEFTNGGFVDQSTVFSDDFTNQHLGGTSFGSIVDRGDLTVTVESVTGSDSLLLGASGGGTGTISACSLNGLLSITNTDTAVLTCGSLTAQVLVGPVEIHLGEDITAILPSGATATITEVAEGQFIIENSPESTVIIVVEIQGRSVELHPGENVDTDSVPSNHPPTPNAGPDQTVECASETGTQVTLNGTGSSDTDGDTLTFTWTGPFGTASGPTPTVILPLGTHTITLTVDDGADGTDSDEVVITVEDTTPPVPDLTSLPDVTGECSAEVTSTPTATDACVGPVTGTTSDPLSYLEQGTFTVTWTFDDGNGNTTTQTQTVVVQDTTPPVPDLSLLPDATGECSAEITSAPTATDNCAGTLTGTTSDPLSYSEQDTFTVTWTFDDGNGNTATQTQTVVVQDVTPPNIASITASPDVLWPPNHKMVPVTVAVSASDNCGAEAVCQITGVSSNEPEDGLGDGDTAPDWEINGDLTVNLRAERSGTGSGRVYEISVACTDASGNRSMATVPVTVPHNREKAK